MRQNPKISKLPNDITVWGDCYLNETSIEELPDKFFIGGSLILSNSSIKMLPNNFNVGGDLDLRGTNITKLPENISVGGDLRLSSIKISNLQSGQTVRGKIYSNGKKLSLDSNNKNAIMESTNRNDQAGKDQRHADQERWKAHETAVKPESGNGSGISKYVLTMLYISIVVGIASALSGFSQYSFLNRGSFSTSAAETYDMIYGGIATIQSVIYLLTGIGFLMWFHRSHKNLPSLGAEELVYSPGWAVGGFFVPFLNLVRPYQVAKEVFKASHPSEWSLSSSSDWKQVQVPSTIKAWWTFLLLANISEYTGWRVMSFANTIDGLQSATVIMLVSDILSVCGAYFAIKLVKVVDENQSTRRAALEKQYS